MRRYVLGLAITALALLSLDDAAVANPTSEGQQLMARFECNRCHEGTQLPQVPLEKHCTRCHKQILDGTFPMNGDRQTLARWQSHLISLPAVPSLTAIGQRLRRDFVEGFLLKPHDLRPNLVAMMPRLALTPDLARTIAMTLVPSEAAAAPLRGDAKAGQRLLTSFGCGTCHRFSGAPALPSAPLLPSVNLSPSQLGEAIVLAPDLRFTRDRYQPALLAAWLRAPRTIKPDTKMPQLPLSAAQADDLAAYIMTVPLAAPVQPALPTRLPVLTRRVSFDEVNEQVFRRTCWHCHATPEYAMGDGGPGNTGGFGFKGRGLNVASYSELASGSLDDQGQRRSVFLPIADGTPRLVAVLLARQHELRGEELPGLRGMPLGLPALTPEQVQLVESWIAQGRPQ